MKAVLISIHPKWCELIASGKKTIEVRKSAPKEVPFKAYIYMTATKERCRFWEYITAYQNNKGDILNGSQKVIGEFVCDKVYSIKNRGFCFSVATEGESITDEIARQSCLDYDDMVNYLGDKDGYGWHISDLKIYDKPKELSEFRSIKCTNKKGSCSDCIKYLTRPSQSWMYVEELE